MATKTLVDTDSTQSLSGKTLVGPVVNAGTCGADPVLPLGIATKQYIDNLILSIIPIGVQWPYGGSTPPAGWLLCDGTAVSRSTYSQLFSVLGTAYGAGDGATTFNLPNKAGRSSMGAGSGAGLTTRTRGNRFGSESEIAPVQAHSHTYSKDTFGSLIYAQGGQPALNTVSGSSTLSTSTTGGSGTHANIHPVEVDTWMIKAL